MALFYKKLDNEDLARMSFAELRKHATKAVQNTQDLADFEYAAHVMQHCIARLRFDPQHRPKGGRDQNQDAGNRQQQQQQGGDRRR